MWVYTYDIPNVSSVGYDVVVNRPKATAYRAPGAPIGAYGIESALDELAQDLGMDPMELRLKNAAKQGTKTSYGPTLGVVGNIETMTAAIEHPHYSAPLGENQGRGVASAFWFNVGGETSVAVSLLEDGTVMVTSGSPDIGGSRASLCNMAAEVLGCDIDNVKGDYRGHQLARLQPAYRWQPRHLCRRHRRDRGDARYCPAVA